MWIVKENLIPMFIHEFDVLSVINEIGGTVVISEDYTTSKNCTVISMVIFVCYI